MSRTIGYASESPGRQELSPPVTSSPTKSGRPALPATLGNRIGFRLHTTSAEITTLVDEELAEHGLKGTQYGLLALLEEQGGISQQEAAACILVDRTTMVSLVDELEHQGHVERRPNLSDRRRHALHLTAAGRRVVRRAHDAVTSAERRYFGVLDADEQDTLRRLLVRLDEQPDNPDR
jgi:DNA-binding MarR family transcriptional regulator